MRKKAQRLVSYILKLSSSESVTKIVSLYGESVTKIVSL
jgi:hypothetical protein